MKKNGRPKYTKQKYEHWLEEMKPFLKAGYSLYSAIEKSGLSSKKDSIYRKYRLNDWFCEKINTYHQYIGELTMSIFSHQISEMHRKSILGRQLTKDEIRILCFAAAKYKGCAPFFMQSRKKKKHKLNSNIEVENVIDSLGN